MSTQVYLLELDFLKDPEVFEKMRSYASLGRRLRADKYRFREDRIRSLGAGLLLRYVTGLSDEDMAYESAGKPYFPEHPELAFSLSHAGMLAALVVSQRRCGIDTEEYREEKESFRLIAEKFFTEEERNEVYVGEAGNASQKAFDASAFARIWTRKEAYVKMTGEGIGGLRRTAERPCFFPELPAPEGYALSLCREGGEPEEVMARIVPPEELSAHFQCP